MVELESEKVLYERDGPNAIITLNRPDRGNSFDTPMKDDAVKAIRSADADEEVRVIILTGSGDRAFCTGSDLEERIPDVTGEDADLDPGPFELYFPHEQLTTPMIAAVNGLCLAGGMELLQVTDIRIAEKSAKFGVPEAKWGMAPVGGTLTRLPRQIPYCEAMRFLLTGETFSAEHVRRIGLVNEVVPDGESLEAAKEIATQIGEISPFAAGKIKEAVSRGLGRPLEDAFRLETQIGREVLSSADAIEGPKAFMEDREPDFRT